MRPLKLTLSAFGPFPGEEHIDFTLLGQAPFFLINGPTGSGKSTLLDSICYALYGMTTGNERTGDQMRSDMAKADTITQLSFEFELGSQRYLLERRPEQWLPKQRGEGLTKHVHAATLSEYLDEKWQTLANKPSQVNQKVIELMGLSADQFRQVMVIPQGKFRELLLASSKEREQIFGQLFNTGVFSRLENALAEKAADIKKSKEAYDQQLQGIFDMVEVENEPQLEQALQVLAPQLNDARKQHQMLNVQLGQVSQTHQNNLKLVDRFALRDSIKQQLVAISQQQDQINIKRQKKANAQAAAKIDRYYDAVQVGQHKVVHWQQQANQLQQEQVECIQLYDSVKLQWQAADRDLLQLPDLQKRLYELEEQRKKLSQISSLKTQSSELEKKHQQHQQQYNANQLTIDLLHQQAQSLQQQVEQANLAQQQLAVQQLELEKLSGIAKLFDQFTSSQQAERQVAQQIVQLQQRVAEGEIETNQLKQKALKKEKAWLLNRAAEIAAQLEPYQECPVCGSIEHPQLAQFSGDAVTKSQVDQAREAHHRHLLQLNEAKAQLTGYSKEQQRLTQEIQLCQSQLSQIWSGGYDDFVAKRTTVTDQIEQLSNFDSSPLIKQQKLCQSELEQKGQDQLQLTNVIEQLKLDMASLQAKLAMLSGDNDNPVISLATLHHEFQELEQNIQQLKQQEAALARKLKQQENQLTVVTTQIASAQQELAQWQQQLIHDQQSWQSALESSPFTVAEEYIAARLQPEQREQLEAEITQYELTLARLESQLEQLNSELAQSELPDLSESEQRVQQVQQQVEQALEAVTAFQSQFDAFHQAQSRLTIVRQKNQALEQRYQVIGTLSDVANGKNHLRVSLHRFVLGVLLDDVLIQASTRLQRMSHGRYRLIRKIERSKGNASSGLELLVEDSYTSKCRDVATLSGGESFIAALSLALALSDVVQAHSGGIRLDTLFIDEGFGSLDAESLDLAIQTLIDLQKGGRTIGIISHVNELKEQMECRIDIKRDRSGSMISLVS